MGKTIQPAFITLRRAHRIATEVFSGSQKTTYLRGLHELARSYGSHRGGRKKISLENFPAIKAALGKIEVSFLVNNFSVNPDISSLIRAGIKASLRDLATYGMPKSEKKGYMVDFRFDRKTLLCNFKIIPEGSQKVKIAFEIFSITQT
jgi:ABC-type microcin C transport system duplicated ATPase subunit YejF